MNREINAYFLKSLHRSLNIPIIYGIYGKELEFYQPFKIITENNTEFITKRLEHIYKKFTTERALYELNKSMVMLGIIANRQTHEFVLIGPVASTAATEESISDYLFEIGITAETVKKLAAYLKGVAPMTLDSFKNLLVGINSVINNEVLSSSELTAIFDDSTVPKIKFAEKDFNKSADTENQSDTILVEEYNRKLNYCVMNGDLEGLSDLLNNMRDVPYQEVGMSAFRELKISTFGSVFAAETIALKSGIPAADVGRTKQFYLNRIDNAKDSDELHRLAVNALYEFTKQVKDYLSQKTKNPTINRAINYIKSNVNSKLVADDIAKALHINAHYLFTKFKAETGMTLTQYINNEKVKKACYYLMFTDKSLIDIAVYLSFSSQTYFQTVFKQIMGQTPNEWRKHNTYIK